jgi:hypothetical protein
MEGVRGSNPLSSTYLPSQRLSDEDCRCPALSCETCGRQARWATERWRSCWLPCLTAVTACSCPSGTGIHMTSHLIMTVGLCESNARRDDWPKARSASRPRSGAGVTNTVPTAVTLITSAFTAQALARRTLCRSLTYPTAVRACASILLVIVRARVSAGRRTTRSGRGRPTLPLRVWRAPALQLRRRSRVGAFGQRPSCLTDR